MQENRDMAWIKTDDGYVNLATASSIRDLGTIEWCGAEVEHWSIVDQFGQGHRVTLPADVLERELAPIVPAYVPTNLHAIWFDEDAPDNPIWVTTYPVIAWRAVAWGEPEPIVAGSGNPYHFAETCMLVIDLPGGRVHNIRGDIASFTSLDDAKKYHLEQSLQKAAPR
jgi:hypothetical protein